MLDARSAGPSAANILLPNRHSGDGPNPEWFGASTTLDLILPLAAPSVELGKGLRAASNLAPIPIAFHLSMTRTFP